MKRFLTYWLFFLYLFSAAQQQNEIDSLEQALSLADISTKTEILNRLSELSQKISVEKAVEYDLMNLEIQQQLGNKRDESSVLNNLGIDYYLMGDYSRSLEYFEQSLKLREELLDTANIVKTLNNLGVISQINADYNQALTYLQKSLLFKLKLDDTLSIAKTLNNIGVIYMDLKKHDDADRFLRQAQDYYGALNDISGMAASLNNLGQNFDAIGNQDSALIFYQKSIGLKKQINDERGLGNTLNNVGIIYFDKELYREAKSYFEESRKIREKIGDRFGLASTLNNLANISVSEKKLDEALRLFDESNQIAHQENLKGFLMRNYGGLSRLYEIKGKHEKALEYYKMMSALNDSIFSEDFNKQLADLRINYENEKQSKENEILQQKNQIQQLEIFLYREQQVQLLIAIFLIFVLSVVIVLYLRYRNNQKTNFTLKQMNIDLEYSVKKRTRELEEANSTKDRFFSIIAHDLKNPFTALLGFSEILSNDFDQLSYPKKKEIIHFIKESTENIYKLLENLLDWASAQSNEIQLFPAALNINQLIREVISIMYYQAQRKSIRINFLSQTEKYAFADEDTIKTVIRNLISNAIKFTPKGGMVQITSSSYEISGKEKVNIRVKDNGIGIKEEALNNLFDKSQKHRSEGTEKEPGTGLGLILCKEFVEKNGGEIIVESEFGSYSQFSFSLPANPEPKQPQAVE